MTLETASPARSYQEEAEAFFRDGYVHVPGVIDPDEAAVLRELTDRVAENPEGYDARHTSFVYGAFVLRFSHEVDPRFAALIERPSIRGPVEAALGPNPAFNAMNVIRNQPGEAISNWHVDDTLEHPLPDEIARFDARIRMPVLWLTAQIALSPIETLEDGPTEFVPASHYSGRRPPAGEESPRFEGRGPVSIYCQIGDLYLTNHQCWHRGAPNRSTRARYLMQVQYSCHWADRRFRGLA